MSTECRLSVHCASLQRVTLSVTESSTQWTLRLSTGSVKAHVLLISEGCAVSDAIRVVILVVARALLGGRHSVGGINSG